ncbi:MAG TPA: hypothetical protein VF100_01050, partial [Thermoanaerobaculia bacterium]
ARGAVSVTERVGMIKRVRDLAVACARASVESRERLGHPLLARRDGAGPPPAARAGGEGTGEEAGSAAAETTISGGGAE